MRIFFQFQYSIQFFIIKFKKLMNYFKKKYFFEVFLIIIFNNKINEHYNINEKFEIRI